MKKYFMVVVIGSLFLSALPVQSQGIKSFIERLDAVEQELKNLDDSQKNITSDNANLISKHEKDLQAIQIKIEENTSNNVNPVIENSVAGISSQLEILGQEVAVLKDEILRLDQSAVPGEAMTDLKASFSDLKNEIEFAFASNKTVVVNTVAPEVLSAEAPMTIETSADVGFASKYVWRGILLTDDAISQPSATFAANGISLNVWSSMDMTDVNGNDKEVNELDYTLDYSFDVKSISISFRDG